MIFIDIFFKILLKYVSNIDKFQLKVLITSQETLSSLKGIKISLNIIYNEPFKN